MENYKIPLNSLIDIVEFAREHPDFIFYTEPMDDGSPFLSCQFYNPEDEDNDTSGIWEFDEVE